MEDRSVLESGTDPAEVLSTPFQTAHDRREWWMQKRWGCLLLVLLSIAGCHVIEGPLFYYSGPIRASVIDEETGRPLQGAVVVAKWYLRYGFLHGGETLLYAEEAVTNERGEFVLKGLPLRIRYPFHRFRWDDPQLWIYKPGYSYLRENNLPAYPLGIYTTSFPYRYKRQSFWNGKQLALQPLRDPHDQLRALERMEAEASYGIPGKMHPKRFPNLWRALIAGYDQIPRELREKSDWGNPRETWQYWVQEKHR